MRKPVNLLIVTMLVLGVFQIMLPSDNFTVQADPLPPDTQFIDGDWIVNGTENRIDEVIVLNGSLIVNSGGSLTLQNVTLAINCTSSDGEFGIEVNSSATLIITDVDGDPITTSDSSNITDSPFDVDNDDPGLDFEYQFQVNDGATLSISNSLIRECGYDGSDKGLTIETDYADIQNCTFRSNYYGISLESAENFTIANNDIEGGWVGIYGEKDIRNGQIYGNKIYNCLSKGIGIRAYKVDIFDNHIYNNVDGIYSKSGIVKCRIFRNDVHDNSNMGMNMNEGWFLPCTDNQFFENDIHHNNEKGLWYYGHNTTIYGNEIHNNVRDGLDLNGDRHTVRDNHFHNNSQMGVRLSWVTDTVYHDNIHVFNGGGPLMGNYRTHLRVGSSDGVEIYGNTFQYMKTDSELAVSMPWNSNLTFHNNTVTYNGDFTLSGAVRCDLGAQDSNLRIIDNNISYNYGRGLYVYGSSFPENSAEIRNNFVYQNTGYSLTFTQMQDYTITNNTFITAGSTGVFVDDCRDGEFSNNTVYGSFEDFYIRDTHGDTDDTHFVVTNCSFDPSSVRLTQGYPDFTFESYLHVYVTDINGPVPDALIRVRNASGKQVYQGNTDSEGWIRFIRLANQTQITSPTPSQNMTLYFDPYNISSLNSGDTAYGEIEPIMYQSQTVNVIFGSDLLPESPKDLTAVSQGIDVYLSWTPSHSPDLDYYQIYRNNTVGGWSLVDTTTFNYWTDLQGASDWSTYKYRVRAVDQIGQTSSFSNIVKCGDWAIGDTRTISDFSVALNGSFIILPTGDVTLRHVNLGINSTYQAEFGVQVRPGGQLTILDNDNDPQTLGDQSNISAVFNTKTMEYVNFYFKVEGSLFEMRNSRLFRCGSDEGLTYPIWYLDEQAQEVITMGEPWKRGLYAANTANMVIIENCNLTDNFVAILIDDASNCIILNNNISNNIFGIYLNNTQLAEIYNNIFYHNFVASIFLYNSDSNTIHENNITNDPLLASMSTEQAGIAIYETGTIANLIFDNNIAYGDFCIYMLKGGSDNEISNNNFFEADYGMFIYNTTAPNLIQGNYFKNNEYALTFDLSDSLTIRGGGIRGGFYGFYGWNSDNISVSDIYFEDISGLGIAGLYCYNMKVWNTSFKNNGLAGVAFGNGDLIFLDNITIEDSMIGFYIVWNAQNVKLQNSKIFNVEEAVISEGCYDAVIENSSLSAIGYILNLTLASIILINTTFNHTRVKLDNSSSISYNWYVDILVLDWLANPVPNAQVQVRKVFGTLVFNGFSDANGYARWILLHERTQFQSSNETSNPYFIFADYGNHSGSLELLLNQSGIIVVSLENTAPTASNVIINPIYPTTISDLTLSYQYTDPENDPEGSTQILWYIDGIYNNSFDNMMVINSGFTSKGQTWFCEVIPHDGTVYGIGMISTPVSIQNTPPEVSNVIILEANPRSSDNLHVDYTYFDIDDDPETWSLRKWMVDNGTGWVYSGVDSMELSSIYTKEGDKWRCLVSPGDGDDYGTPVLSPMVVIYNSAPEVQDATIQPESPKSNETLMAIYTYYDLDNDPESGSIINWFKNGIEEVDLNGSPSVDPLRTQQGDKWYYVIIPSDGEDFGAPFQSDSVVIANTPPSVSNVTITPASPGTADDLIVEYDYYDEDGDLESDDTIIKWYRMRPGDIEFSYTGYQGKTLSSTFTTKDEIWKCEVIPHDGLNYGINVFSPIEVTIGNSPPSATDLSISPSDPQTGDDLISYYEYSDLDSDLEEGTTIIWFRDGNQVTILDNLFSVPSSETQKGEVWYFKVKPKDGFDFGTEVRSQEVTIQNSVPEAKGLEITPRFPLGENNLVASYVYYDEDGDLEVSHEIRWYKNGLHQEFYDDMSEVESAATEKGDLWYFTLRVFDGKSYSEQNSSFHIEVQNSQPIVTTVSPEPQAMTINETESLEFFIDVSDPDGDFLLFKWRLDKSSVGDAEYYKLETDYDDAGVYTLNLSVSDVGEKSYTLYYEWDITVNNVNRLPEIEVSEPLVSNPKMKEDTSLRFLIEENDLDEEDTLEITWYFDDVVAQEGGTSYTYHASFAAAGDHVVRAVVDDGTDTTEYSWDLSVEDVAEVREEFAGMSYDAWGLVLAILSGIAAVLLSIIGLFRVKKKKGALKIYMTEIDDISSQKEEDPGEYEHKLNELEDKINSDFREGHIEDLHYLMLQDMLTSRRGDVRRATISQKFEGLPEGVTKELDDMLKDGKISHEEYEGFVATISQTKSLSPDQRKELNRMIEKWEVEDKESINEEPTTKKVKPEKEEFDDVMDEIINGLEEE
ncbi:MAG: right-handed parallel beta-helix repeat-containing protein [Thermoplasmata archaeon]|nr:MAG: right-handed parallel beta-helix repeat-containing protein [Thermoplasmata archaeon]